jgi:hypothetical protein
MGRYNWISGTLWTLSVLACGFAAAPQAQADFADEAATSTPFGTTSICNLEKRSDSSVTYVGLKFNSGASRYFAGGSFYSGQTPAGFPDLTETHVETCLNTTPANLTNFAANGADGTKTTDTYMGFSFTLITAAGGLNAGDHEFQLAPPNSNSTPTADAGTTQTVNTTDSVTLDGRGQRRFDLCLDADLRGRSHPFKHYGKPA